MAELFKDKYRIQSARCPHWDYSSNGAYFITICTDRWECFFGNIENNQVILSDTGRIAEQFWAELPAHFLFVKLDVFVIMPNHVHGILIIDRNLINQDQLYPPFISKALSGDHNHSLTKTEKNKLMSQISPKKGSISTVIRSFKSACTKEINKTNPMLNFKWQSRFHDHIIHDKQSHKYIRHYVLSNPAKWNDDLFYR